MARKQLGVVSRRQLLDAGLGRRAIAARVERGFMRALYRGVYVVGATEPSRDGEWVGALLACGWDGAARPGQGTPALGHRTAAALWGLAPHAPRIVEVIVPLGRRSIRAGIRTRRQAVRPDEIEVVRGIPVTCVARTVFDLAGSSRPRELERAWSEMEVRRLTSRVSVPQLLERYPGRPGAAALRALLRSEEPGGVTRNDFEEDFVALLDAHELPRPRLNADLWLRGRFIEVDCLWQRQRVAVELDGRAVHGREAAVESDKRRDRELLAEGWRTSRVTWRQLREEPEAVMADLRDALGV